MAPDQLGHQRRRAGHRRHLAGPGHLRQSADGHRRRRWRPGIQGPGRQPRADPPHHARHLCRQLVLRQRAQRLSPLRVRRPGAAHVQPGDHRRGVLPERTVRYLRTGDRRGRRRSAAPADPGSGADARRHALAADRRFQPRRRARGRPTLCAAHARTGRGAARTSSSRACCSPRFSSTAASRTSTTPG